MSADYDFIVVGSGFGGSVSALRLAERGYRVLVIEKGLRRGPTDFARTNWDLPRWLWMPSAGLKGIFQMSFLRHLTVLHGVGVGGGSLVYAATLPTPKRAFFEAPSWGSLASWERELAPHYDTARQMLGVATNPRESRGDRVLRQIASEMGRSEHFHLSEAGIHFGPEDVASADPYFDGKGPERFGCTHCGGCMTGCRVGAKNSLDFNYLHLAEKLGVTIQADTEVLGVHPDPVGYRLNLKASLSGKALPHVTAAKVIFAGGVMGSVPLLLAMKEDPDGLPMLSPRVGDYVRTNSEALLGCVSPDSSDNFSEGIAITSILHTDEHSHVEPVRYAAGSGFFRLMVLPHAAGDSPLARLGAMLKAFSRSPSKWARALTVRDFAKQSQILLYMRSLEGALSLRLGRSLLTGMKRGLVSEANDPAAAPQAFMPEASQLAERFSDIIGGVPMSMLTETLLGTPTTAHILGGACMGVGPEEGVIDHRHRVFGYDGLYVIDGASISANPGVNPSLTITALAERAMDLIES